MLAFSDLIKANAGTIETNSLNGNKAKVDNAFKHLDSAKTRGEKVVYHLIPVLHLVQDEKLHAWQNEFFGEVFIKVLDPTHAPKAEIAVEGQAQEKPAEAPQARGEVPPEPAVHAPASEPKNAN